MKIKPSLLLLLALTSPALADWRSQNDADRFNTRMNELWRNEQRMSQGIIDGARLDMANQTMAYYQRRAQERDARFAAFQKAMSEADAREREARAQQGGNEMVRPTIPSGAEVLAGLEQKAASGDRETARLLGDIYRTGHGAALRDMNKAVSWYTKAAENGDAAAASTLGSLYASGDGVSKDDGKAFHYTLQAAQGGDEVALANAGTLYEFGIGTAKDEKEALRWYRAAAEKNSVRGQSGYGRALLLGKAGLAADAASAMQYLRPAATAGDSAAQMFAANTLITGANGVARDAAQALRWYESAAREFPSLNGDLASIYANGERYGLVSDPAKTVSFARAGAEKGDGMSAYLLANAYFKGEGITRDDGQGRQWIRKSADSGYAPGLYSYSLCLRQGVGGPVDIAAAERVLLQAADAGFTRAQYDASMMLFPGGQTVPADIPRAVRLMQAAAEGGHAEAQANYANFLETGELLPANPQAAREWAKRSADQGSPMGMINYGDMLLRGVGGPADIRGAAWLEKATQSEAPFGPHAAITLGRYYRDGRYLPKDLSLARQWLQKARSLGHPDAEKELSLLR